VNVIALAILVTIFLIQVSAIKTRASYFLKSGFFGSLIFMAAIFLIFGFAAHQSWQTYILWEKSEVAKMLLPPYKNLDYFIFYSRNRFFVPYFLSLSVGLLFLIGAQLINKKYQERFFERIEPYLLATVLFVVGHPLWLFYLVILLAANFLFSIFYFLFSKKKDYRLSFYYFWLSAGIFTILISKWLSALPWWTLLKL